MHSTQGQAIFESSDIYAVAVNGERRQRATEACKPSIWPLARGLPGAGIWRGIACTHVDGASTSVRPSVQPPIQLHAQLCVALGLAGRGVARRRVGQPEIVERDREAQHTLDERSPLQAGAGEPRGAARSGWRPRRSACHSATLPAPGRRQCRVPGRQRSTASSRHRPSARAVDPCSDSRRCRCGGCRPRRPDWPCCRSIRRRPSHHRFASRRPPNTCTCWAGWRLRPRRSSGRTTRCQAAIARHPSARRSRRARCRAAGSDHRPGCRGRTQSSRTS